MEQALLLLDVTMVSKLINNFMQNDKMGDGRKEGTCLLVNRQ